MSHVEQGAGGHTTPPDTHTMVRLQKALAHAGVASRRACEMLITRGRVQVNGNTWYELASRIDPTRDEVRVDGVIVQLDTTKRYFVLNKPCGVVSTMRDEDGRRDLSEFTEKVGATSNDQTGHDPGIFPRTGERFRLYNVGRLDTDTSGLIVLTNDGELAHKLAHPSFGVPKTYVAKVRGRVSPAVITRLKHGVELSDGPIHADRAKLLSSGSGQGKSLVEITLHSGRNRIVRRLLAAVGHPVEELVRRQFGPLSLGSLRLGQVRELSAAERGALLSAAEGDAEDAPKRTPNSGATRNTRRVQVTAGRPGDGRGARGMRGVAARGKPHVSGGQEGAAQVGGNGSAPTPVERPGRAWQKRNGEAR